VQVGSISGRDISLPDAALRSCSLELMGLGIAGATLPNLLEAIKSVLHAALSTGIKAAIKPVPLADVDSA